MHASNQVVGIHSQRVSLVMKRKFVVCFTSVGRRSVMLIRGVMDVHDSQPAGSLASVGRASFWPPLLTCDNNGPHPIVQMLHAI